jgi:hypothetical protein
VISGKIISRLLVYALVIAAVLLQIASVAPAVYVKEQATVTIRTRKFTFLQDIRRSCGQISMGQDMTGRQNRLA